MTKKDISQLTRAADELLSTDLPVRHRRILENYRRHALLEIMGRGGETLEPSMIVEQPVHYYNIAGMQGITLTGIEASRQAYEAMERQEACVTVLENERIAVADWGFASESVFNTYLRGYNAADRGLAEPDDPQGYYIAKQHLAMFWLFDEKCRLVSEHVYENMALHEVTRIPAAEFITLAEARSVLGPMLRPLPPSE